MRLARFYEYRFGLIQCLKANDYNRSLLNATVPKKRRRQTPERPNQIAAMGNPGLTCRHIARPNTMRAIWFSFLWLICIGSASAVRGGIHAYAERTAATEERVRSNIEAKADRLALYRQPELQQSAPTTTTVSSALTKLHTPPAQAETVTWQWREGSKIIVKVSSSGEKSYISRAKSRSVHSLHWRLPVASESPWLGVAPGAGRPAQVVE
jgi:hypothetical protein